MFAVNPRTTWTWPQEPPDRGGRRPKPRRRPQAGLLPPDEDGRGGRAGGSGVKRKAGPPPVSRSGSDNNSPVYVVVVDNDDDYEDTTDLNVVLRERPRRRRRGPTPCPARGDCSRSSSSSCTDTEEDKTVVVVVVVEARRRRHGGGGGVGIGGHCSLGVDGDDAAGLHFRLDQPMVKSWRRQGPFGGDPDDGAPPAAKVQKTTSGQGTTSPRVLDPQWSPLGQEVRHRDGQYASKRPPPTLMKAHLEKQARSATTWSGRTGSGCSSRTSTAFATTSTDPNQWNQRQSNLSDHPPHDQCYQAAPGSKGAPQASGTSSSLFRRGALALSSFKGALKRKLAASAAQVRGHPTSPPPTLVQVVPEVVEVVRRPSPSEVDALTDRFSTSMKLQQAHHEHQQQQEQDLHLKASAGGSSNTSQDSGLGEDCPSSYYLVEASTSPAATANRSGIGQQVPLHQPPPILRPPSASSSSGASSSAGASGAKKHVVIQDPRLTRVFNYADAEEDPSARCTAEPPLKLPRVASTVTKVLERPSSLARPEGHKKHHHHHDWGGGRHSNSGNDSRLSVAGQWGQMVRNSGLGVVEVMGKQPRFAASGLDLIKECVDLVFLAHGAAQLSLLTSLRSQQEVGRLLDGVYQILFYDWAAAGRDSSVGAAATAAPPVKVDAGIVCHCLQKFLILVVDVCCHELDIDERLALARDFRKLLRASEDSCYRDPRDALRKTQVLYIRLWCALLCVPFQTCAP